MINPAITLATKHFAVSQGQLLMGGIPVGALAETYGTPLFIYDRKVLDEKIKALRQALPPRFVIHYSAKANPNPSIVRFVLSRGCGLEVASGGELRVALEAGCEPRRVLFAGPGKTEAEIEMAVSHGIGEIHVESLTEIRRVGTICRRLGLRSRVAIRVNPAEEVQGGAMRMGGRATPFGVDEEVLDEAIGAVLADQALEFRGIHLFAGTQILDSEILLNQYRYGLGIARRVADRLQRPLASLDFGGGLGIPYFAHEKDLNLERLGQELAALCGEVDRDWRFSGTQFLIEPGRFLVGEAGVYIARINDIKVSRGKKFLILDGGMNHHLAASGNLGQTIKRNYPAAILNKLDASEEELVDVVGPLCTPLDTLARNVTLPHAEIGDLFGIFQSGAYGRSASPLGFLSHPNPAEVWVDGGGHWLMPQWGEGSAIDDCFAAKSEG